MGSGKMVTGITFHCLCPKYLREMKVKPWEEMKRRHDRKNMEVEELVGVRQSRRCLEARFTFLNLRHNSAEAEVTYVKE